MPLVHTALPIRRVEDWLDAALASLEVQSHRNWTATLVHDAEDGEDPATLAIARAWADRDERIRLETPGRVGLVGALNRAVGDRREALLLARFDGDDLCHPERFAQQVAFLENRPDVDVVDARTDSFRSDDTQELPGGMARYQHWHDGIEHHDDFVREFLVENPVCHPAAMVRLSALQRLDDSVQWPYREGDFPEDYDLWLRLLRKGARFHKLSERLVRWRDHDERTSRVDTKYRKTAFFELKWEHFEDIHLRPGLRTVVWGGRGHGKRWTRALVQAGQPPIAVVDIDPQAQGSTRQGVNVVAPDALSDLSPDLVLLAVGAAGARSLMEAQARDAGVATLAVAGLAG